MGLGGGMYVCSTWWDFCLPATAGSDFGLAFFFDLLSNIYGESRSISNFYLHMSYHQDRLDDFAMVCFVDLTLQVSEWEHAQDLPNGNLPCHKLLSVYANVGECWQLALSPKLYHVWNHLSERAKAVEFEMGGSDVQLSAPSHPIPNG